ncbi:MAG TPA: hypothetical protein VGX48_06745 [Pyrinomonadaceae bacterium]|jgi:hypothetical protein|nr:hypothetical protein [Pyrinomonadaceae bacterium]
MIDWQMAAVALIVLAALLYVARRGLARLRSFKASGAAAGCATGCGKCGESEKPVVTPAGPVLVQIKRDKKQL